MRENPHIAGKMSESNNLASAISSESPQIEMLAVSEKDGKERSSHESYRALESPVHEILEDLDVERDVELESDNKSEAQASPVDPYLVTWNGPSDPGNPRNWTFRRKWAAVFVVSSFTFISPVSSSMVAPALPSLSRDIGIHSAFESAMVLSIFVLAYAVGPLFFGPLSEVYGRVRVVQSTNILYFAFNLGCGFAKTSTQMLVFRFFAGFGGSAMLALGGGILADCFAAVRYSSSFNSVDISRNNEVKRSDYTCWVLCLGQVRVFRIEYRDQSLADSLHSGWPNYGWIYCRIYLLEMGVLEYDHLVCGDSAFRLFHLARNICACAASKKGSKAEKANWR
jgi:hypothetical protein